LERLCDLYFELSNEDRLKILQRLGRGRMNVTTLARELGTTNQECSRHVSRLSEALLVEKDPEGLYGLTAYGELSLRMIPAQMFIAEHRSYFNTHSLKEMPSELVCRIGELQGSEPTRDVMVTFNLVESVFKSAEEYIWMIHDQYLLDILPLGAEALRRGVRFRSMDSRTRAPQRNLEHGRPAYISKEDEEFFRSSWIDGTVEVKHLDQFDVFLYVSEREAIIAFPLTGGDFDYLGFSSGEPKALDFCRDLFEFYWGRGVELRPEMVLEAHEKRMRYYVDKKDDDRESEDTLMYS
jgi:predicted transcriptional regulator